MISPHFEKMAGSTEGVEFIKVDVDEAPVSLFFLICFARRISTDRDSRLNRDL